MKNTYKKDGKGRAIFFVALLSILLLLCTLLPFAIGKKPLRANAETYYSSEPCEVESYTVNATVNKDRSIDFDETITFTMNRSYNSFYRSLPLEGDRYFNIQAFCEGNEEFSFDVADNPDVDGFLDINCYGGIERGARLTYRFTYTMQVADGAENGLTIDFVGAGWPFTLKNVTVNVDFPAALKNYTVYSSAFGEASNDYVTETLSADGKSITMTAEELPLCRSEAFDEYVAAAITLDFSFDSGVLDPYIGVRIAQNTTLIVLLIVVLVAAAFVLIRLKFMKKPILNTVVGFRPPENYDPLTMGKFIDGIVNNEDITSMVYYFASKGYLKISLEHSEPVLLKQVNAIAADETPAAHTLFQGLFKSGDRVCVSDLTNKFYTSVDYAKNLLRAKEIPMYAPKSLLGFIGGCLLAFFLLAFAPMAIGWLFVGGGYFATSGLIGFFPILVMLALLFFKENHRYKLKKNGKFVYNALIVLAMAVGAGLYLFTGSHLLTELEKILLLICAYAIVLVSSGMLTRTERYTEVLGRVLGFKEFITVTKEDKIKFLLEQNPELFYDLLPYAQVLGVTDEWEDKFKDITLEAPRWYVGDYSAFDYWYMRRCMFAMNVAMISRPQEQGSRVGRSGGGGSFGGFSGGGRGGGGGGFR
ncbi:MAG: DUF2207 domain-containing protein [Clostridia bacterium]|nr:DUF2207 domain-containing protein [Clostridia bacterium]